MGNYWEQGAWPVDVRNELSSGHFEDIRKRLFLLEEPNAGYIDLYDTYGKGNGIPYDPFNWAGNWSAFAPPSIADPGQLIILYKDHNGVEDLYINYDVMSETQLDEHPPVRSDGTLDLFWRLAPNPNLYHHWDFNAGKPSALAVGRWRIFYHGPSAPCNLLEYTCRSKAHRWLPQQTDPYCQIEPLKDASGVIAKRHSSYEITKEDITRELLTGWDRSLDTVDYEQCKRPRRLTEYALENGEPAVCSSGCNSITSECEISRQCHRDPKINSAYQDGVIHKVEVLGSQFLKPVGEQWVENYIWASEKVEWDTGQSYSKNTIAYTDGATEGPFYVCYLGHSPSTAADKPGVGANWQDYWKTPAYQPEYLRIHPVYAELGGVVNSSFTGSHSWHWGCNDSAFELLLRELGGEDSEYPQWSATHGRYFIGDVRKSGDESKQCIKEHDSAEDKDLSNTEYWEELTQFDWWWDTSYPAVPIWLYKKQYDPDAANWPLPRGCWRRTWKHSFGRLSTMMWPGEKGDPPGYEQIKFIVTRAVYVNIPEANQKFYAVQDVEALHAQAYTAEHEALIAKRHDPVQTRHHSYYDSRAGQTRWASTPMYELAHDLVNDLRNVLLQLHLVDDSGLNIAGWQFEFETQDILNSASSMAAYAAGRISALQNRTDPPYAKANPYFEVPSSWEDYGYLLCIEHSVANDYFINPSYAMRFVRRQFQIYITKQAGASKALNIAHTLVRIAYKGSAQGGYGFADGCELGFEELTVSAAIGEATEKNAYVRCILEEDDTVPGWCFNVQIISPWPATDIGGFFDFICAGDCEKHWKRTTQCHIAGDNMDRWCVLDMDWDLIPESVFADDLTNYVEIQT